MYTSHACLEKATQKLLFSTYLQLSSSVNLVTAVFGPSFALFKTNMRSTFLSALVLQVGKKIESGTRSPSGAPGLFFQHAGHRSEATSVFII